MVEYQQNYFNGHFMAAYDMECVCLQPDKSKKFNDLNGC